MQTIKIFVVICFLFPVLVGCSIQRAQQAEDAKTQMIGMSKEDVFTCMGPPVQKSKEGKTEIWSYQSGNGHVDSVATGTTFGSASANAAGNNVTAYGGAVGVASGHSEQRFCIVNLVMAAGKVKAVNYNGPTGGLLTKGEQCAYAVENCIKHDGAPSPSVPE